MQMLKQTIYGTCVGLVFLMTCIALGIVHAQTPTPTPATSPHYHASFAPIRTVGRGQGDEARLTFINPALVIRLQPDLTSHVPATILTLADGETVRAAGDLPTVAHILRVSVWLEEENQ